MRPPSARTTETTIDDDEKRRAAALFAAAAKTYGFRDPTRDEVGHEAGAVAYVRALIAHVHKHDWAAAHELRLLKSQAE